MIDRIHGDRSFKSGDIVILRENKKATFSCYSFGAKPSAIITWYLSGKHLIGSQVQTRDYTRSRLYLRNPTVLAHHNHTLRCRATGAGSSMAIQTIKIEIVGRSFMYAQTDF